MSIEAFRALETSRTSAAQTVHAVAVCWCWAWCRHVLSSSDCRDAVRHTAGRAPLP